MALLLRELLLELLGDLDGRLALLRLLLADLCVLEGPDEIQAWATSKRIKRAEQALLEAWTESMFP